MSNLLPPTKTYSVGPNIVGTDYNTFRVLKHRKYRVSITFGKNEMPTLEDWLYGIEKKINLQQSLTMLGRLRFKHSEILIRGDIILRDYC